MDITSEEYSKCQEKIETEREEIKKYHKKEAKYKKLIKQDKLKIKILWRDETSKLDMNFYNTIFNKDIFEDIKQNFSVLILDLDRVLNFHCGSEEEAKSIYPKDRLWNIEIERIDFKMVKLIEYIESGELLSPPVIDISDDNIFLFYDGNHRVALSRFLGLKEIPFVVRKSNIERLKNL